MTFRSPVPHPLHHGSWSPPALATVGTLLGASGGEAAAWPAGDEAATWDVADRWYALADALTGPRESALSAADQIIAGLTGAGIAPDGFRAAWERLSGDETAPLNALVQIAAELGQMVEEAGREIEAAKLAAWLEILTVLTELTELSIVAELTLGAAAPAAEGLVLAGRVAIEQIFARLTVQLAGRRPIRSAFRGRAGTGDNLAAEPTRRLTPPAADDGSVTRRLARPSLEPDPQEKTRRLDPKGLLARVRSDFDRPAPPAQSHGRAIEQVRREEFAEYLDGVAASIKTKEAAIPYAAQLTTEAARLRQLPHPGAEQGPAWARSDQPWSGPRAPQATGGLRPIDPVRRKSLTDAMPDSHDGRPDPRQGGWFSLLNAGGPSEDPTRGLNCLDAVLALFETYQLGAPRVAGARVFDGYAYGAPDRPVGGEWSGVRRIQRAVGTKFQNLCPFVGGADPAAAREAIDAALRNLANHLHNSGPASFAVILTDFESGGCHAWAAINQDGTILYLDPQLGRVSVEEPLYRHRDRPGGGNVVSMDALVVDGHGNPAPLPYHGAGQWIAS